MNLRPCTQAHCTRVHLLSHSWERIHPDDRTPANAVLYHETCHVAAVEWVPPHQRLQVRLVDAAGREFALTPHELEMNGARNG